MAIRNGNRLLLHLGFWVAYYGITCFNELYLTSDFMPDGNFMHMMKTALGQLNILVVKMALVYYVLYSFIPRWQSSRRKAWLTSEGILILLTGVFLCRIIIQFINWELIFGRVPAGLSATSLAARFFYSLLDVLQVVSVAAAIRMFRLRLAATEREKELLHAKLRSELLHLKSQINPHFLFNMLNSIYALAREQSPATPEVVQKLSELLRYMLYETDKDLVPVQEEVRIMTEYISLQQLRFGQRVRIDTDIRLAAPAVKVTPLLMLPLVENAFKHGVGTRRDNSFISLKLYTKEDTLSFEVVNSLAGAPMNPQASDGIGLSNIRRQLELLYKDFDFSAGISGAIFTVHLTVNTKSYAATELFDRGR